MFTTLWSSFRNVRASCKRSGCAPNRMRSPRRWPGRLSLEELEERTLLFSGSGVPDDFGNDFASAHSIALDNSGTGIQAGTIDYAGDRARTSIFVSNFEL